MGQRHQPLRRRAHARLYGQSDQGHIMLLADLMIVQDPVVMMTTGFMYCVEFFADKVPGVDTGWDILHSFIRIPAGAARASLAIGDVSPAMQTAAFLVGGTVTTTKPYQQYLRHQGRKS